MSTDIRYAATYNGPSYGSFDPSFEGFTSLAKAKDALRERVNGTGRWPCEVVSLYWDADGRLFKSRTSSVAFPATSSEDYMDLYPVTSDGYRASEPNRRLTVGPRGGVVSEKF